jgi:hypothetical protein
MIFLFLLSLVAAQQTPYNPSCYQPGHLAGLSVGTYLNDVNAIESKIDIFSP